MDDNIYKYIITTPIIRRATKAISFSLRGEKDVGEDKYIMTINCQTNM